MPEIYIIGHKNPDTDSIASAYTYAELKKKTDPTRTYTAARSGNINTQTRYIFQRAEAPLPVLVTDVYPKVENIMVADVICVEENTPVYDLVHMIDENDVQTLPVVDVENRLKGLVGASELIHLFIQEDVDLRPRYLFNARHIERIIKGSVLHPGKNPLFKAAIMVGAMTMERSTERLDVAGASETLLVVGNRKELIEYAVDKEIPAIIITGTRSGENINVDFSNYKGWVYISSLDSAETVRRVILASPVSSILNSHIISLNRKDYVDTAAELMLSSAQRAIPITEDGRLAGIVTRSNLLNRYRQKVILVDHNEAEQAVDGIETAEVLEIIDHHRLGAVKTTSPITFYAKPVGSTCTLVYQLYKSAGITPGQTEALLLMGGIISDTVMLKSPTTTPDDRTALEELEKIAHVSARQYGMDIFSATDNLSARTPENIVMTDFKKYSEYGLSVGIGQVEVVTLADLEDMREPLLNELERQRIKNSLDWAMLLVTDIIMEESVLLCTRFPEAEKHFSYRMLHPNTFALPGILSRKKQLLPEILRILEEIEK